MALIQFATNSYKSRSAPLSSQRCINILAERQPESTKVPVAMFGAPGVAAPVVTCGTGPIRLLHVLHGGSGGDRLFVVSGTQLFEVVNGNPILKFTGFPASGNVAVASDNGVQLCILIGQKLFVFLTSITQPIPGTNIDEYSLIGSTTVLTFNASVGEHQLRVQYTSTLSQWQVGDVIVLSLDNGAQHRATLNVIIPYATIRLTAGIGFAARKGSQVIDTSRGLYTFVAVDSPAGTTTLPVASGEGTSLGDGITIGLDNGTTHTTTIDSVFPGNPSPILGIVEAVPSLASAGSAVGNPTDRVYAVTDPNFFPSDSVTYFDNYFVFARAGTNQFFLSENGDGTTFPPLAFASALVAADNVVAVFSSHETLLVFGQTTIETWYDAGTPDFPFQRYDGATIQRGCGAPLSIVLEDEAVHFMGSDLVYYRLQGVTPTRISTHAIETAWRAYFTVEDCYALSYTLEGHKFIVLTFPFAQATWVYDISTQLWHERMSYDLAGTSLQNRWRVNYVLAGYDNHQLKVYAGDLFSGQLGVITWDTYTEFNNLIQGQVISPPYKEDRKRLFISRFELDVEVGVGSGAALPIITLTGAVPSAASAGNAITDTSADRQVPTYVTSLAQNAIPGSADIVVPVVGSMGVGDTLQIALNNGTIFSSNIRMIRSPANPQIFLDYSKDGGFTYSTPQLPRSLGHAGEYQTRLRWLRLGQSRQWYFRLTIIDPVKRVIIAAHADIYPGI